MNKYSLKAIILSALAMCGLIIPHFGFAANPKNKVIAKKAAIVKNRKPAAKKVIKAKVPAKKQIKKGKPTANARLKNIKVRKPARQIKKQPAKPNPKNKTKQQPKKDKKNKFVKDAAASKIKNKKPAPAPEPAIKSCPICMDDKPAKEFIHLQCGHADSCQDCTLAMFDDAIQNKAIDRAKKINESLRCPHVGDARCNKPFTEQDIQSIVKGDAHRMQQYRTILDEEWIHENTNPCRTPDCKGRFAKDPGAPAVRVRCPECKKQCCSACLLPHNPQVMSCKEAQAAAEDNGDRANAAWLNQNAKPCPACNTRIEKNGGCNAVTCQNCRYAFCWVCGSAHDDTGRHVHVYLNRDGFVEPVGIDPVRMADTLWFDPSRFDYHEYLRQHNFQERQWAVPGYLMVQFPENVRLEEIARGRDPLNPQYDKEFADIQLQELAKLEQLIPKKVKKKKKIIRARKAVKPKVQSKKNIKKIEPGIWIDGVWYKNLADYTG